MDAPGTAAGFAGTAIDAQGHDPSALAIMGDWTNSEYGRIRVQYNREDLNTGSVDNQFLLQYIMSIGAHGAHPF
jgi:hypothetical protein